MSFGNMLPGLLLIELPAVEVARSYSWKSASGYALNSFVGYWQRTTKDISRWKEWQKIADGPWNILILYYQGSNTNGRWSAGSLCGNNSMRLTLVLIMAIILIEKWSFRHEGRKPNQIYGVSGYWYLDSPLLNHVQMKEIAPVDNM